MSLILICASPGTGLRSSVASLVSEAESVIPDTKAEDVETLLCRGLNADSELEELTSSDPYEAARRARRHDIWNMEIVTDELPRRLVVELWRLALRSAIERLGSSGLRFLSCHPTLYSYRSNEFYSPVSLSAFPEGATPSAVLILMDDVYDMYTRLSQPGQVYEGHEASFMERVSGSEARLPDSLADECEKGRYPKICNQLRLEARINALQHLLAWRRADMVTGELIASQWPDTRLAIVGTKQDRDVLARWAREDVPTAYLSHPISRPRRALRAIRKKDSAAGWDAVPAVGQFNDLQSKLAQRTVFAIMPTAIDEFRIPGDGSTLGRQLRLDRRWPIPEQSDLLYEAPNDQAPEYEALFDVGPLQSRNLAVGFLRGLEMSIRDEIAFRDHLLVAHTNHLVVFRPLYEKGDYSDGVLAEIEHWEALASSDASKRAVFLNFNEDLEALVRFLNSKSQREELTRQFDSLRRAELRDRGLSDADVDLLAADSRSSELKRSGGHAIEEWREWDAQARQRAAQSVLWKRLTRVTNLALSSQVAVVVVQSASNALYRGVAQFLKSGDRSLLPVWEEQAQPTIDQLWLARMAR